MARTLRAWQLGLVALATLGPGAGRAEAASHHVRRGDIVVVLPLTVGGSFEAKSSAVDGEVSLDPFAATFTADLRTLDTGIDLRNQHLREKYLEVGKGEGFEVARLSEVEVEGARPGHHEGKHQFHGKLQVHGQTVAVAGTVEVRTSGDVHQVEATFPLRISDFQIEKPRHLGVGVKDDIRVKVSLDVAPAAGKKP